MTEIEQKKIEDCLREITEVLSRYDAKMGGCGCCNSGWITIGDEEAGSIQITGSKIEYQLYRDGTWQKFQLT